MRVNKELGLIIFIALFVASCSSTGSQTVYTPGQTSAQRQQMEQEEQALAKEQAQQEEQTRRALERERRDAEESARREAERQREMAARRAEEQARVVAEQQARIDALRAQIAANEAETERVEAANALLRQAVAGAEELTDALASEEEKYNNTDPATGEPLDKLATAHLQELAEEVEDLNNQAESLLAQP